jgi:phospho-N-acetylmuramoyl-pentapeptide-transferase
MTKWMIFLGLSIVANYVLILILRRLKGFQNIYEWTPKTHQAKKNTPSFGGIGILISLCGGIFWFIPALTPEIMWTLSLTLAFGLLGFLDDLLSKVFKTNEGLTARDKFLLQWCVGIGFIYVFHLWIAPLALWQGLFYAFVIVASSNATNLTDGLDGLLSGLSLLTLCGFMWVFQMTMGVSELIILTQVAMVAVASFLVFNRHPAKVFMGDTGSMALGALFAGLSFIAGNPWLLLPFGAIYLIETLSVIVQVLSRKFRGKRVFLMSPLHHHFEMLGMSEQRIVALFWGIQWLFLVGYILI